MATSRTLRTTLKCSATRRIFSGFCTVQGLPGGFLLTMDAVVLNCVIQFSIVWRVGTFPFLPMSKCRQKTCCVTVPESLFLKNISTATTRCCSDQRCMMTEGFKLLYPAMCVLPHHLQRCQHGNKFKSSNCYCPTLYNALPTGVVLGIYCLCFLVSSEMVD